MFKTKAFIFSALFILFPALARAADPGDIVISQIKTGETGAATDEFIELYNMTGEDIMLDGWSLKKKTQGGTESNLASSAKFTGMIPAERFFLIAHPDYKDKDGADLAYSGASYSVSANNTVILYDENGVMIDKVGYGEAGDFLGAAAANPDAGQSIMRKAVDGVFTDSSDNSADFILSGSPRPRNSRTTEPPADTVETGIPSQPSVYADGSPVSEAPDAGHDRPGDKYDYSDGIVLSEIFPNPYLSDESGEFIEIHNQGEAEVDLTLWRIGDDSGRQYVIPTSTLIKAGGYYAVYRRESGIVLENAGDSVKLYKPLKKTAAETAKFKNAPGGKSYILNEDARYGKWVWVDLSTPGEMNAPIKENNPPQMSVDFPDETGTGTPIIFDASDITDDEDDELSFLWDFGDGATSSFRIAEHTFFKAGVYKVSLAVSDGSHKTVKEQKIKIAGGEEGAPQPAVSSVKAASDKKKTTAARKTTVKKSPPPAPGKISGTVAVLPGVFGVQYFYILAPDAVQVYNYKKDFPGLAVGDRVEVSGELSEYNGLPRVKTAGRADIKVLGDGDGPEAEEIACADMDKGMAGRLVRISGTISGKKGQTAYLDDDSGEAEVYVKKGTDISMGNFTAGDKVSVTGLLVPYKDSYQLWPRSVSDIRAEKEGSVLGESATSSEWTLAARDKKKELTGYLLILAAGAVAALGGTLLKKRISDKPFSPPKEEQVEVKEGIDYQ